MSRRLIQSLLPNNRERRRNRERRAPASAPPPPPPPPNYEDQRFSVFDPRNRDLDDVSDINRDFAERRAEFERQRRQWMEANGSSSGSSGVAGTSSSSVVPVVNIEDDDDDDDDNGNKKKIFVTRLRSALTKDDITNAFVQFGVEEVEFFEKSHKSSRSGTSFSSAFVMFESRQQASNVLQMQNIEIRGSQCPIFAAEDVKVIFLGYINDMWNKQAVEATLANHNIVGFEGLDLMPSSHPQYVNRGYGFLKFSSHADAMVAFSRFQAATIDLGHPDYYARFAFADPPTHGT